MTAARLERLLVHRDRYCDSAFLMRVSRDLRAAGDLEEVVVSMATVANLELLESVGFTIPAPRPLPSDLVIALRASDARTLDEAVARTEQLLASPAEQPVPGSRSPLGAWSLAAAGAGVLGAMPAAARPVSLAAALRLAPDARVALISVAGQYAAREARAALLGGLHVMMFSDNLAVADEIALKDLALSRGLLHMGPDCGTAILCGVPLGFANRVPRGPIGLIGASGTGLQEISVGIARRGLGVSQAIGLGGRDLRAAVGGRMGLAAIAALAADPATAVLVLVAKSPDPGVARQALAALAASGKPSVAHLPGLELEPPGGAVHLASTLEATAAYACALWRGETALLEALDRGDNQHAGSQAELDARGLSLARELRPGQRFVRGLFAGGSLCDEAYYLLRDAGLDVQSNHAHPGVRPLSGTAAAAGHAVIDLGEDEFTRGRPHPMIDPAAVAERMVVEAADPEVAVLLFDCVLGFGAHHDPASVLCDGVLAARRAAGQRPLAAIASVCGLPEDPQDANAQSAQLREAGVLLAGANAGAARLAARIVAGLPVEER